MGRILALDYGTVRIGVAVSDEGQEYAFPRPVILHHGRKQLIDALRTVVETERIEQVVVGLPLTMRGERGNQAKSVETFAQDLGHELGIPVHLEDERLTSSFADRFQGAGASRDSRSAALILESYLERMKRQRT